MKKFISVALATAMIASMGVTAFAKTDKYPEGKVKDVTFDKKMSNGEDEVYFRLMINNKYIVDGGATAGHSNAALVKTYKDAKAFLAALPSGTITVGKAGSASDIAHKAVNDSVTDTTAASWITDKVTVGTNADAAEMVKAIKDAAKEVVEEKENTAKEKADAEKEAVAVLEVYKTASKATTADMKFVVGSDGTNVDNDAAKTVIDNYIDKVAKDVKDADAIKTELKSAITGTLTPDKALEDVKKKAEAQLEESGSTAAVTAKEAKEEAATAKADSEKAAIAKEQADKVTISFEQSLNNVVTDASLEADLTAYLEGKKVEGDIDAVVDFVVDHVETWRSVAAVEADIKALAVSGGAIDKEISRLENTEERGTANYDDIEDIDDLKVSLKLTEGEDYVADYYIDEIDNPGSSLDGQYAIIIELNDNYTTKNQKIKGTVTLKSNTKKLDETDFIYNMRVDALEFKHAFAQYVEDIELDDEDAYINLVDFNQGVIYTTKEMATKDINGKLYVEKNGKYYEVDKDGYVSNEGIEIAGRAQIQNGPTVKIKVPTYFDGKVAKFTKDVENIELEDNHGFYFDVKASDQGKLNLSFDNVAIKSVTRVAPIDADLTFYNFYGYPEFDFTGTVTITPEDDDVEYFIYKVAKDGKISKVNAKLNDDGDAYEFKTRTLGCYVLSDMELDVDDINAGETTPEDKPADGEGTTAPETVKPNPGTGL